MQIIVILLRRLVLPNNATFLYWIAPSVISTYNTGQTAKPNRNPTMRRIIQLAGSFLSIIGVLLLILWAMRGARPAIECGLLDALTAANWPAVYTCLDRSDYDPIVALVAMLGGALLAWAARLAPGSTRAGAYNPTPEERKNNRAELIRRVRRIWITGYLDQSLYQEVLLYLGMKWNPADPPPNPFGMAALRIDGKATAHQPADIALTVGAPLAAFYANVDHRLLILGAPGAGKTTVMLDLAKSYLDKAEQDLSIPVPVVFTLSSWPGPATPFEDWLVSEIRTRYGGDIREDVARYWLAHNELALFLDGLDELPAERRAAAIAAIETQQTLGSWFVVCSRAAEYADLGAKKAAFTNLDAVAIQPLRLYQIQGYLGELRSEQAARLSAAITADTTLQEVADTPLMLNVMLLASEVIDWTPLAGNDKDALRSHIYDAYVRAMVSRPRVGAQYRAAKTLHWLQWLAQQMVRHDQTVFLLERMNRSWFNIWWQRHVQTLALGLSGGLAGLLIIVPILGIIYGMIGGLTHGLIEGTILGLNFGFSSGLVFGPYIGVAFGLLIARDDINVQEQMRLRYDLKRMVFALVVGFVAGLVVSSKHGIIDGLYFGVVAGLQVVVLSGIIFRTTTLERSYPNTRPNYGIYRLMRNGLMSGMFFGLTIGLVGVFVFGLTYGMSPGLGYGLSGILLFGPFFGLFLGWDNVLRHYALRFTFFLHGSMPLRYVRFLDACADRILLRKVGGGYMFIHRTFQEHIAALTPERIAEIARWVEAQLRSQ